MSSTVYIAKADFDYMAERHFKGMFTIPNKIACGHTASTRMANAMKSDRNLLLVVNRTTRRSMTSSPDGATWRTVRLVSAFRTEDGKLCVIEIEPPRAKEGGDNE